jgi:hypothetical protein
MVCHPNGLESELEDDPMNIKKLDDIHISIFLDCLRALYFQLGG